MAGRTRGALYLKVAGKPGALVVLSHDAVRLPCGLVLPTTSRELPLTSLADSPASVVVGDGAVCWTGPACPVVVQAVREWAPAMLAQGAVTAATLAAVRSRLSEADPGIADSAGRWRLPAGLAAAACGPRASAVAATRLLGHGPGLTPSGDDVLAGFLAGAAAFGLESGALRKAVTALAPARTTALSAALLWHAARGECIDELAAVAAALTTRGRREPEQVSRVVGRLLSVGHSSGAALTLGLLTAADGALNADSGRAA